MQTQAIQQQGQLALALLPIPELVVRGSAYAWKIEDDRFLIYGNSKGEARTLYLAALAEEGNAPEAAQ